MSGAARSNYIRVPTAYNNIGFEVNDLPDYGTYNGSLQRSLSSFSDDAGSFGSLSDEVPPSLDSFDFQFDSSFHCARHQVSSPSSSSIATSGSYTAHWTDVSSPRHGYSHGSQEAVTGSLHMHQPSSVMSTPSPEYVCLYDGCRQKAFRRSADLDRHIKHVHNKPSDMYFCDYNKCPRSEKAVAAAASASASASASSSSTATTAQAFEASPSGGGGGGAGTGAFGRKDHCRAHYRDYHREDLCRRNGKEAAGWFDGRNISGSWWRCTKCLRKVSYQRCGWECRDCGQTLEPERINARKRKMKGSSRGH